MEITVVETSERKKVKIARVEEEDFKLLTKKKYFFPWMVWKDKAELFKLFIAGEDEIMGVMALLDVPADRRIEIKLLACSIENTTKNKMHDGIAGCLIAYACREAVKRYADLACVSLLPKTRLKGHYVVKYNMIDDGGRQLFLEGKSLIDLILKYLL